MNTQYITPKALLFSGCLLLLMNAAFASASKPQSERNQLDSITVPAAQEKTATVNLAPKAFLNSIDLQKPLTQPEVDGLVNYVLEHGMQPNIPESEIGKQLSWQVGPRLEPLVRVLEKSHDPRLLAYLTKMADYLMAELNDPQTGEIDFLTEVRAPVWYWKLPAPQGDEELNDIRRSKVQGKLQRYQPETRESVYWADPLCTGAGYMFTGRLALYIINTPALHNLPVPSDSNYNKNSGSTYLEKATHWMHQGYATYSYFLDSIWFDADRLLWHQKKDPALDKYSKALQGDVLAYNRYFKFDIGYDYIARGLRILDPETYGPWADRSQEIIQSGIRFWQANYTKDTNEHGPYLLWSYREKGRTEDTGHLIFDLNAIAAFKKAGFPISNNELTAIENTLIHIAYNPQKDSLYRMMDGGLNDSTTAGYAYYIPGLLVLTPWAPDLYDFYAERSRKAILPYVDGSKITSRVIPLTAKLLAAKAERHGVAIEESPSEITKTIPNTSAK